MNELAPPPRLRLIPESAPFSAEQRDWLDGFFAAVLSLEDEFTSAAAAPLSVMPAVTADPLDDGDDGSAPWHDQCIALPDRMALADGRPLRRRMMAAMAQQDCGQCGYNCEDYANAIFLRKEARSNLCAPGGKATERMLNKLLGETTSTPGPAGSTPATIGNETRLQPGSSRDAPVEAVFLSRVRINKPESEKETWHIEFDLEGSGLDYTVGDAFGVYPTNDAGLVGAVIAAIGAAPDRPVADSTLAEKLSREVSLGPAPDRLFELIACLVGGERRRKAKALAQGEDPDGDAASLDLLAALEKFPEAKPDPEALIEALDPLQPRLYSIASSPRVHSGRLALCVDTVRYTIGERRRLGVASSFLAERASLGQRVRVYARNSAHFRLPADPAIPIVMVGPGTGIAPFRAFLQERTAAGASGRNWLFFGHQRSAYDFLYEEELKSMEETGSPGAADARLVARGRREGLRPASHSRAGRGAVAMAR